MSKNTFNTHAKTLSPQDLGYALLDLFAGHWKSYTKPLALDLIERGADLSVKDDDGRCASFGFIGQRYTEDVTEVLQAMIKHGLPLEVTRHDQVTPLMECVRQGRQEFTKVLINGGANVNARDEDGKTCLMYAADWASLKILNYLINAGADVKVKDDKGMTAYDYAFKKKKTKLMEAIVDAPIRHEKRKNRIKGKIDRGLNKSVSIKTFGGFKRSGRMS